MRIPSTITSDRTRRQNHLQFVAFSLDQRFGDVQRVGNDGPQIHRRQLQREFAARDARRIQQIIEQAGHMLGLARNHTARPLQLLPAEAVILQQFDRMPNRRHRIAQLMRQGGQKRVFLPVRGAQFLLGPLQRFEICVQLLARFGERRLGAAPLGNVLEDEYHAANPALIVQQRRGAVLDRYGRAVRAKQCGVIRKSNGLALAQHPCDRVFRLGSRDFIDEPEHPFEGRRRRESGTVRQSGGDGVEKRDVARRIRGNDRIADRAQGDCKLLCGLPNAPTVAPQEIGEGDEQGDAESGHENDARDQLAGLPIGSGPIGQGALPGARIEVVCQGTNLIHQRLAAVRGYQCRRLTGVAALSERYRRRQFGEFLSSELRDLLRRDSLRREGRASNSPAGG